MGRATTRTKLSLWRFAEIMGIEPRHFEGVVLPGVTSPTCDSAWFQWDWQNSQAVSRETLALAIAEAERQIEDVLGYHLVPDWEVNEWHTVERPNKPELVFINQQDRRNYQRTVHANFGHFISGGQRGADLIAGSSAITWSDEDGDGIDETGTVTAPLTAATADANECEVQLFYPGKAGAREWQIRPVDVTIAAGVATCTFNRALALLESIQEDLTPDNAVDFTIAGNFLTAVDVYRIYNDPSVQTTLMWEPIGSHLRQNPGEWTVQTGVLHSRDIRLGILAYTPATWDEDQEEFTQLIPAVDRGADVVRLWYYSGYTNRSFPCCETVMSPEWERVVAYRAASLLNKNPCDCNPDWFEHWREDLSFQSGGEQFSRYGISRWQIERVIETFGDATRGAEQAYRACIAPSRRLGTRYSAGVATG